MCLRSGRDDWHASDMPLDNFRKLLPYFRDVQTVVLEGWGEPLLYRDLIECIRLVKEAGAEAGFVTSGKGLDEAYARQLISAGIDFIGFSLSGATAATHNSIRVGSDFDELLETIKYLTGLRKESGPVRPRLHLVYLMLKENIRELPALIPLARNMGIGEIVLLNQIAFTNVWQEAQRVHEVPESQQYQAILKETAIQAVQMGIGLRRPSLFSTELAVCDENPLANLYVSVDGEVSPCVYLDPPLKNSPPLHRLGFGNIFRQSFSDIWTGEQYRAFRGCLERRKSTLDGIYARLGAMGMDFPPTENLLPDAPEPCRKCYKLMGA